MFQQLPAIVSRSPLMQKGGFEVFEGFVDRRSRQIMLKEAIAAAASAVISDVPESDGEQVRGGSPARRFSSASGGPAQEALYHSSEVIEFLRSITASSLSPTGGLGTYTYYSRPGDYLAIHRDIVSCDVAVITCLHDKKDAAEGGGMCLYPSRLLDALADIRATPETGAFRLRLLPGQTIVMFGGIVPHQIFPVASGQARVVSVLCYRLDGSAE
jgi:hypothetical protein